MAYDRVKPTYLSCLGLPNFLSVSLSYDTESQHKYTVRNTACLVAGDDKFRSFTII